VGVTRILDLMVILLLATVVLLPRPDASVKAALVLEPEQRARVAELQSTRAWSWRTCFSTAAARTGRSRP